MMSNNTPGRKTLEVKEMWLETSDRFSEWTQLVVKDQNGDEWILEGDYCGGIPVSSWHKVRSLKKPPVLAKE